MIDDTHKSKSQLLQELAALRQQVSDLQADVARNAELYAALQQQTGRLALLHDVSTSINSTLDLNAILTAGCRMLVEHFAPCDHSAVLRFDDDHVLGEVIAEYPDRQAIGIHVQMEGNASSEYVLETLQPLPVYDAQHDPRMELAWDALRAVGVLSILIVPLIVKGRVLGTISLDTTHARHHFTAEEIELAQIVASQLAAAVENARLYAVAQQQLVERERAEATLLRSEENFRKLFEVNPFPIAISRRSDSVILKANPAALDFFGIPPDQIGVVQVSHFYVTPEDRARVQARLARDGGVRDMILPVKTCGDERRWVLLTALPMTYDEEPAFFIGVADITERRQAEEALRKLSQAVEQSPSTVVITDTSGAIEYANPKFTQLTGYDLDEVAGQNPQFLKSEEHDTDFYRELWETLGQGAVWRGEFRNRKRNGELYWESASISPIRDDDGTVTHFVKVAEDITERKAAEQALRKSSERLRILREIDQSILAARSPEAIAMAALSRMHALIPCQRISVVETDPDGAASVLATEANHGLDVSTQSALRIHNLAVARCDLIHGVADLAALPQRSPLQDMLYAEGVRAYLVIPLLFQGERIGTLNLESTSSHFFTAEHIDVASEIAGLLAVAIRQAQLYDSIQRELAERRRAEKALRKSDAKLRRYAAELESQNAELDAFAHTVAHDLKTPLTTLIGFSALLESRLERLPPERVRQDLARMLRTSRKMANIVDELLLFASVRKKEDVKFSPLAMADIVAEALGRLADLIAEYDAHIVIPEQWPVALGYGPWVEEIWVNYLSNAVKYGGCPEQGDPSEIELGFDAQPSSRIRFWVRDNGPGISPEEQTQLFAPFERLSQMHTQGHGLGLSIVRRIVEKLGGEAGVESAVGEGATFYFTLPAEA